MEEENSMLEDKASRIRLLILDVDGVMTDGRITLNEQGEELKSFFSKDGHGIRMLMEAGVDVVLISGRDSVAVEHRARDLGIPEVYQGVGEKGAVCDEITRRRGLQREEICCIGDDLPDLAVFSRAGLAVAVGDAAREVQDAADYVTERGGGKGGVREVCELILKAKKKWPWTERPRRGLGFTG